MKSPVANHTNKSQPFARRPAMWVETFADAQWLSDEIRHRGRDPGLVKWHIAESEMDVLLTATDKQLATSRAALDFALKRFI